MGIAGSSPATVRVLIEETWCSIGGRAGKIHGAPQSAPAAQQSFTRAEFFVGRLREFTRRPAASFFASLKFTGEEAAPGTSGGRSVGERVGVLGALATKGRTPAAPDAAVTATSSNSNAVAKRNLVVSDPPTQAEMQSLPDKVHDLLLALRR